MNRLGLKFELQNCTQKAYIRGRNKIEKDIIQSMLPNNLLFMLYVDRIGSKSKLQNHTHQRTYMRKLSNLLRKEKNRERYHPIDAF